MEESTRGAPAVCACATSGETSTSTLGGVKARTEHSLSQAGAGMAPWFSIGSPEYSQHGIVQVSVAEQTGSARKARSRPIKAVAATAARLGFFTSVPTLPLIPIMMRLHQSERRVERHLLACASIARAMDSHQ